MFTAGQAASTSDNDQVKPAGKDYVNVKPVWPKCVWVLANIYIYIYTYIYIHIKLDNSIYSHKCKFNVDLY